MITLLYRPLTSVATWRSDMTNTSVTGPVNWSTANEGRSSVGVAELGSYRGEATLDCFGLTILMFML